MNTTLTIEDDLPNYQVRFDDLFHAGRCLSFPCNDKGLVDIDALSERARENYLYARAMVGREYSAPAVFGLALAA